jgi:hypothetical protein
MIHHISMSLKDPAAAATVLAWMTGGKVLRAPTPPFPQGAWFVCLDDAAGGMLELLPQDVVLDPEVPLTIRRGADAQKRSGAHVLVTTPLGHDEVIRLAQAEGWRADEVETGLFKIVKVWVQDAFLVEFIAQDEAERYVAAFGPEGLSALDVKLRALEKDMAEKLESKLPKGMLERILGEPTV